MYQTSMKVMISICAKVNHRSGLDVLTDSFSDFSLDSSGKFRDRKMVRSRELPSNFLEFITEVSNILCSDIVTAS